MLGKRPFGPQRHRESKRLKRLEPSFRRRSGSASNWEVLLRDDFGRPINGPCNLSIDAPCGWAAWDQLGRDPAIDPTRQVFEQARARGVSVFFITGRPENQRVATERNL